MEIKSEAGHFGDAQHEGMASFLQDCATDKYMSSWQTLRPALLITVSESIHCSSHVAWPATSPHNCSSCLECNHCGAQKHLDASCLVWCTACLCYFSSSPWAKECLYNVNSCPMVGLCDCICRLTSMPDLWPSSNRSCYVLCMPSWHLWRLRRFSRQQLSLQSTDDSYHLSAV